MQIKFRIPEILFGALLAVAIFAMGFVVELSLRQSQNQKKNSVEQTATNVSHPSSSDERIADYTLALAWLTGVLAFSTIGLWIAAYLTLRHGRETAERQLRAYVHVTVAQFKNLDGNAVYSIEYQNSGQTPAYDVHTTIAVKLTSFPLQKGALIVKPDGAPGVTILGPDGEGHNIVETDRPLPAGALDKIKTGSMAVYVFGEILYRDAFGKPRFTKYRYMTGGENGVRTNGALGACPEGNEAN